MDLGHSHSSCRSLPLFCFFGEERQREKKEERERETPSIRQGKRVARVEANVSTKKP